MPSNINKQKISESLHRFTDIRVIGLLVFAFIVLLVTWSGLKVMQTNFELQKKENRLRAENEIKKLENSNQKLENTYFESNQYLELTARRQFNKAAPGEKLYLIPEEVALSRTVDLPKQKTPAEADAEAEQNKSKYQKNFEAWLDFLFNRD